MPLRLEQEKRDWNIKTVKQYFKENGCTLLEKEFKNKSTKMKYICCCGTYAEIRLLDFARGARCKTCWKLSRHKYRFKVNFKSKKNMRNTQNE